MKSYRDATYATSIITVITAFMTICLHYWGKGHEAAFWNNVALTLFGGAVITLITSVIGYWRERTLALEKFSSLSQKIIGKIKKYDPDWEVEDKIRFFVLLATVDLWDYGACYANIWFFEAWRKKRDDIHKKIYWPIHSFCEDVQKTCSKIHGKDAINIPASIRNLEEKICIYVTDSTAEIGGVKWNYLYYKTKEELNSWYYDMMYPWKAREELKQTKEYKERIRERKKCLFYVLALICIALSVIYLVKVA